MTLTLDRCCPCLDSLFPDMADDTALRTLADLGFRHFEFWDWRTHDLAVLQHAQPAYGLHPAAFSGNTFAEPLLSAEAHPATLAHVRRSVDLAKRLGTTMLVVHVGYAVARRSRAAQWRAAVDGLRAAAAIAGGDGITLLVEPLNSTIDHPDYFLDSLSSARQLIEDVGQPSVRLLLDVYHMWLMHADLLARLPEVVPSTGHVHVADVPGRHEPGTGTIPWSAVAGALARGGYPGLIGVECWPSATPVEALAAARRAFAA